MWEHFPFPLPFLIPLTAPHSSSCIMRDWPTCQVNSVSPHPKENSMNALALADLVTTCFHNELSNELTIQLTQWWPPLWSSGQSSWQQIQRSGFDSRRYQIFWEVVGLERGPISLVSTTEELLWRKSSGSGIEIRKYGHRDPLCWPRDTLYPQKLALTSLTSGSRAVGIVRSRTEATELLVIITDSVVTSRKFNTGC
jgi:hypothetical protein